VSGAGAGERLDKWLVYARFVRHRSAAAELVEAARVRLNSRIVTKPHQTVRPGDVLTLPQGHAIRVVRVLAIPPRRGPAREAQACYEDLDRPTPAPPT
jgi:ribosome-associated heat shock protein Hsp15